MTFGVEPDTGSVPYEQRISLADGSLYVGKNNGRDQIIDRRAD